MDRLDRLQKEFDEVDQQREAIMQSLEQDDLSASEWRELRKALHTLNTRANEIGMEVLEAGLLGPEEIEEMIEQDLEALGVNDVQPSVSEYEDMSIEDLEKEFHKLHKDFREYHESANEVTDRERSVIEIGKTVEILRRLEAIDEILDRRARA